MTTLACVFCEELFFLLGVQDDMIYETKLLIRYAMPGMLVRLISDNFKIFLLNQGYLKNCGKIITINLCIFTVISYILIVKYELGALGQGIGILIYECLNILNLYFFIYRD